MEGLARAANRQVDLALVTAWHTARFALNGWADKGRLAGSKKLSDLLSDQGSEPEQSNAAQAIHFFHSLKARGVPVEITRTSH